MKLLKLEMHNFRQFYGLADMAFSIASSSTVSVIHGENGVGKTTILNAIYWCLYGRTLDEFELQENLVNDHAHAEDGETTCYVELHFSEGNNKYRVRRDYDQSSRKSLAQGFLLDGGNNVPIDGIDAVIGRMIPISMAPYFFFHGEGINDLGKGTGKNSFKDAIRAILGFEHGDHAVELLRSIRLKWQKQWEKLDRLNAQAKQAIEKEAVEQENFLNAKKKFEQANGSLAVVEEELGSINAELAKIKVQNVDELNLERQKLEKRQRQIPGELEKITRSRTSLVSKYGWSIYGYPFLVEGADVLSKFRSDRKIPAEYNDIFVKSLLNSKECICGTPLVDESEARKHVESMLAGASTSEQEDAITKATLIAENIANVSDEYLEKLNKLSLREEDLMSEKGTNDRRLEEIKDRLAGIDEPRISKLEADREEATDLASRLRDEKHISRMKMDQAKKSADEAKKKKNKVVDKSKLGSYQQRLDFIDKVIAVAEEVVASEETSARDEIQIEINERLAKFSRKDYYADVDTDFSFELKKQDGSPVAKSQGEKALLNLSFIASLIQLARERCDKDNDYFVQGTVAPFVIDAPFGELDNQYRGAVAEFLPESTDQLITLLSSSHWSKKVEEKLRPNIGKEYVLISESTASSDQEKTVDEIVIEGKLYECSKYDMPIPRTIVQEVG